MPLRIILETLFMPPALNIWLIIFGLVIWRRRSLLGKTAVIISLLLLWVLSAPITARLLIAPLENRYPALTQQDLQTPGAKAIVVLGGGRAREAPEYGGRDTLAESTLLRVRYGAYLYRALVDEGEEPVPLLVTGGVVLEDESVPVADLMAESLRDEFQVPVYLDRDRLQNHR